ncbi:hypothetical protein [Schleiferilactobacillus shenzhenensis]|nr:hypothetical protein [Schleiferilactobacillus shenzhenensis]
MKLWKKAGLVLGALALATGLSACNSKSSAANKDLTVWSVFAAPSTTVKSWHQSPFHTGLAKATGVNVNWKWPAEGADQGQAFNLMTTQKQLPDIIWYQLMDKSEQYMKQGIIRDMTKELPKKAPHYWKFLQDHPEYAKAMRTDDGKYYMFGFFREKPEQATWAGPSIRKDWLDAQHLSMPTNIAEWTHVMEVFNKVYGAKMAYTGDWFNTIMFAGAFGAHAAFAPNYYVDNGKVKFALTQPEWKNYMAWMHSLYTKGLIDPDVATLDAQGMQNKVAKNKVGIVFGSTSTIDTYNTAAQQAKSKAHWVAAPYPNQADGKAPSAIFSEAMYVNGGAGISPDVSGKKLDEAYKWLDFPFTKKGNEYWNYGPEGTSWTMKNGVPTFTDKVTKSKLGMATAITLYSGNLGYGLGVQDLNLNKQRQSPDAFNASKTWYANNSEAQKEAYPTGVSMTDAESKEAATISNTLNTYVQEHCLKFLNGKLSLDKDYDSFVAGMKKQGLDRLTKIKQDAYDRYEKR